MAFFRHIQRPFLLPLTPFYALVVLIRNLLFDDHFLSSVKFTLPIISVGNITVGGTGKTPHVEYLVRQLKDRYKLAVLSRGYKRKTNNFVLASEQSGVREIGDEPLQIKLKYPEIDVAVDRNRINGVGRLKEIINDLGLIILDDAYQHRYIQPGLSILLVNYNQPVFQDILLPAGNLREPRNSIKRADIIIVTKCSETITAGERKSFILKLGSSPAQEVYFTRYGNGSPLPIFPDKNEPFILKNKSFRSGTRILLVTGIAHPQPFRQYLNQIMSVEKELIFPDHHSFSHRDLELISKTFQSISTDEKCIVTTEKDAVRLRGLNIRDKSLLHGFYYIPVEVAFLFGGEAPFMKRIIEFIE